MDIVLTGGVGSSGTWVLDRLAETHDVVCLDRDRPDDGCERVDYRTLDLTDAGGVFDVMTEVDPTQDHGAFHYDEDLEWTPLSDGPVPTRETAEPLAADD